MKQTKEERVLRVKAYYEANKDKIKAYKKAYKKTYSLANKEEIAAYNKAYSLANKEEKAIKRKAYYEANKDKDKAYREANKDKIKAYKLANKDKWKAYQLANKDKTNLRASNKRKTDPLFKLKCNVRGRTYQAFKMKGVKKESKTAIMLGCSFEELREHLVKKFTKGMTLDNMGLWHIDHIIPLASANNEAELIALCNYQNLQPLWAEDNLIKSDSMPLVSKLYS